MQHGGTTTGRQSSPNGPVIVVTGEDDRYETARVEAVRIARDATADLILYDWDAPTLFGDPLPTWWSAEGSGDLFSDRLDPTQLDAVGRSPIADQVREATRSGVAASGWLPSDHGPEALSRYARAQAASVVVIPDGLEEVSGLEALLDGTDRPADAVAAATPARVIVAGSSGR